MMDNSFKCCGGLEVALDVQLQTLQPGDQAIFLQQVEESLPSVQNQTNVLCVTDWTSACLCYQCALHHTTRQECVMG